MRTRAEGRCWRRKAGKIFLRGAVLHAALAGGRGSPRGRRGQTILESAIVIVLLSFILLACFQASRIIVAKEIVDYSASAGVRARAVGFNDLLCGLGRVASRSL